jgi:hypothetical protein
LGAQNISSAQWASGKDAALWPIRRRACTCGLPALAHEVVLVVCIAPFSEVEQDEMVGQIIVIGECSGYGDERCDASQRGSDSQDSGCGGECRLE